jgi:putative ABC transport system permease protein
MINSFLRLQNVNPGFNPRNVITLELELPQPKYPQAQQRIIFQQQLIQNIESIPGVQYAGTVNNIPFGGSESHNTYSIEGRNFSNPSERLQAYTRIVSPKYFQVMNITIHKGRQFTDQDNANSSRVALINETAARRLWGDEDPIGKRIKLGSPETNNPWLGIIGVVGSTSHTGLAVASQPEVYVPFLQNPGLTITLVARATSDPKSVAATIRQQVATLDRNLPLTNITYMEDLISKSVAQPRLYTFLLGLFAALALLLAAAGIYGVLSYSVGQRTHEIGVRMALGAQQGDIFKLIVGHTVVLISIGLAIGLAISLALSRVMSSLLFGVTPNDSLTFVLISLLLLVVGLVASYIPARRATKVNPLIALRNE